MILAFKVILLILIIIGFIGTVAERKDTQLRNNLLILTIFAILSFMITEIYL